MPEPTENEPGHAIDDLTETVVASRVVHEGRYLTYRVDTIERADGSRAERDVVGHPGAVAILAVDPDGEVLLVRQFRVPAGISRSTWPAGERYCRTRRTLSSGSIARIATAPG